MGFSVCQIRSNATIAERNFNSFCHTCAASAEATAGVAIRLIFTPVLAGVTALVRLADGVAVLAGVTALARFADGVAVLVGVAALARLADGVAALLNAVLRAAAAAED